MSLNWNVQNTKAYADLMETEEESYTQHQHNVLDTLIWATLVVDLPGIPTEEDADEMIFRLRYAERLGVYDQKIPDIPNMRLGLSDDEVEKQGDGYVAKETGIRVFRHPKGSDHDGWYERIDRSLTREDLDEWVGLTTNVSRKTRHQFCQRHAKSVREEVERKIERELTSA